MPRRDDRPGEGLIIKTAVFTTGSPSARQAPAPDHPEVVFVGRSNVGKSSLINMIAGRKALARTSGQPGKTRENNHYLINEAFYLVDLPGLGYAKASRVQRQKWSSMIAQYLQSRPTICLVVHAVDVRHGPQGPDLTLLDGSRGADRPHIVALTKGDKLSRGRAMAQKQKTEAQLAAAGLEHPVVITSASTKAGRDELLDWIGWTTAAHRAP